MYHECQTYSTVRYMACHAKQIKVTKHSYYNVSSPYYARMHTSHVSHHRRDSRVFTSNLTLSRLHL